MRVGLGYDVHRLVAGRDLILGGVKVEYNKGLDGHSDADVLVHAIMDALLGAAGLGDIGKHFPDTDPAYKGISSMRLLSHVKSMVREAGFQVGNIDATIVAQRPKLAPYITSMVTQISHELGLEQNQVNVKATTEEGLGFTGREDGISAYAITFLTYLADKLGND